LDVAVALTATDQNLEKRQLLEPLLRLRKTVSRKDWNFLLTVARLEYARACFALAHYSETTRALRPLNKLRRTDDPLLAIVFTEGQLENEWPGK
jgi:hypothetical protein